MDNSTHTVDGMLKIKEGVVLNVDKNSLNEYKTKKKQTKKMKEIEADIKHLKNEISNIKKYLGLE